MHTHTHTHTQTAKFLSIMMSYTMIQNWFEILNKSGKNMNSCKLDKNKTTYVSGKYVCMAI